MLLYLIYHKFIYTNIYKDIYSNFYKKFKKLNYRISPPNSPSQKKNVQKSLGGITYSKVHFAIFKKIEGNYL